MWGEESSGADFNTKVEGAPAWLTQTSNKANGVAWETANQRETVGAKAPSKIATQAIHAMERFLNMASGMGWSLSAFADCEFVPDMSINAEKAAIVHGSHTP